MPSLKIMDPPNRPAKLYFEEHTPQECDSSLPPVVFLSGLCSLHTTWNPVWKGIADETQRKVFSVELRNHGKSEWNDYFSQELLIADLENFLIKNNIKKCVLVGHSLGGRTSMGLALKRPELVEKIVTEESIVTDPTHEDQKMAKSLYAILRKVHALPKSISTFQARKLLDNFVYSDCSWVEYPGMAFYVPLRRDADGGFDFEFNFHAIEKSFEDTSVFCFNPAQYCPYTGPALVTYSKGNVEKYLEKDRILENFPNAELYKFNFAGHVPHMEVAKEFVTKVSTFIRS